MSGGAGVGHSPTDVQSVDAAVFSERHRSVTLFPGRLEHHRVTVESTSAEDIGVSDAGGYTGGSCCKHRLNLPWPSLPRSRDEVSLHSGGEGRISRGGLVSRAHGGPERLLRLVPSSARCTRAAESMAPHACSDLLPGVARPLWESADSFGSAPPRAAGRPPSRGSAHAAAWAPQCSTAELAATGQCAPCGGAGERLATSIYRHTAE